MEEQQVDGDERPVLHDNNDEGWSPEPMSWKQVASLSREAVRLLEENSIHHFPTVSRASVELACLILPKGGTAISEEVAMKRAARITKLASEHPQLCTEIDNRGATLLLAAIRKRAPFSILKVLADAHPAAERHKSSYGLRFASRSLVRSVEWSDSRTFDYLLEQEVEYLRSKGIDEVRELFITVGAKVYGVADRLPREFPLVAKESWENKKVLLHYVAKDLDWFEQEIVERVVSCNPQALVEHNDHGETPLHIACKAFADVIVVRKLRPLVNAVSARTRDSSGACPLHLFCTDFMMLDDTKT